MIALNRTNDRSVTLNPTFGMADETTPCGGACGCVACGYGNPELMDLHQLIDRVDSYRAHAHVFRIGEPLRALYAVRTGTVKTCLVDPDGREQVLGFYLPGDVFGFNAIYSCRFPCDAVTLENTRLCRLPYAAVSALATRQPVVQQKLLRIMSRKVERARLYSLQNSADARLATFLVDLSDRYAVHGYSATHYHLSMSRTDIASYVRIAAETVSRVLRRFQRHALLRIHRRDVTLFELDALRRMANPVLNTPARIDAVARAGHAARMHGIGSYAADAMPWPHRC